MSWRRQSVIPCCPQHTVESGEVFFLDLDFLDQREKMILKSLFASLGPSGQYILLTSVMYGVLVVI